MPPATADPPAETATPSPLRSPIEPPAATREPAAAVPAAAVPAAAWKPAAAVLGGFLALWLVLVILSGTTALLLPAAEEERPPPVAPAVVVAPVERGPLVRTRGFSGTLESPAVLLASPLVSGRVSSVEVGLGDEVLRGETLVELDPDELDQAVLAAEAGRAVARANAAEATAAEAIAQRTVARVRQLREEGLTSDAEADAAEAERLAAAAAVQVADARVLSAEAQLRTARIKRSQATVRAGFTGGADTRRVAEVNAREGDTVGPGDPLVRLVQLDPLRAVFAATQADHAGLTTGRKVELTTDAYPGRVFPGRVDRLAPAFSEASRQARVEVAVANPEGLLRPGMFARLHADLETVDDAVSVPRDAVVRRDDRDAVFLLPPGEEAVRRVEVELGVVAGDRVQVLDPPLEGSVVVLGQQLLEDGLVVNAASGMGEAVAPKELEKEDEPGRGA